MSFCYHCSVLFLATTDSHSELYGSGVLNTLTLAFLQSCIVTRRALAEHKAWTRGETWIFILFVFAAGPIPYLRGAWHGVHALTVVVLGVAYLLSFLSWLWVTMIRRYGTHDSFGAGA